MSRIFVYARVSTLDQHPENQIKEIEAAGFKIEKHRIISETISGSSSISQRKEFARLIDKMESGDVLVVTKLDRLGRDALDVTSTVNRLDALGIKVYCLALGGVDLTSSTGKLTMQVLNAVAQFERDLIIERTNAGLERAKLEGKILGRPHSLSEEDRERVKMELQKGKSISSIAKEYKTSRQTVMRIREDKNILM